MFEASSVFGSLHYCRFLMPFCKKFSFLKKKNIIKKIWHGACCRCSRDITSQESASWTCISSILSWPCLVPDLCLFTMDAETVSLPSLGPRAFGRYHRIVDRLIGRVCHGGSPDGCLLGKLAWYRCEVGFVVPLDSSGAPVAIQAFRVVSEQTKPICTRYQQTWP